MEEIKIEEVIDKQLKEAISKEILSDLPEWFGLPQSTKEYIHQAAKHPFWVAKNKKQILGFISMRETSIDCAEIYCMGVKKEFHRKGIGSLLVEALEASAIQKYSYLQVKTVTQGHYKEYDRTIAFYKNMGFKKMEVFPFLWDEWNPCLVMVKKIR